MSGTTIGIIIAVIVIIGVLVYIFKDKIFGSKGDDGGKPPLPPQGPPSGMPPTPPTPPAGPSI